MTSLKLLILAVVAVAARDQLTCPLDGCTSDDVALLPATNTNPTNNIYIGGLFGVHQVGSSPYDCSEFRERGLVNTEAFFWAIKKYAERAGFNTALNPVSVGGFAMDSCTQEEKTVQNVYSFETCGIKYTGVQPRNTVAYVGPDRSSEALDVSPLLGNMKRVHVSHAATSPVLSDPSYNYLLRTVPSDSVQTEVMARLFKLKGIRYIQVLYIHNAYGMGLMNSLKEKTAQHNYTCITRMMGVTMDNLDDVATFLGENTVTKYVVLLMTDVGSRAVLEKVESTQSIRNLFTFVGTSSWGVDANVIRNIGSAERAITFTMNTGEYFNTGDVQDFWSDFYKMKPDTGSPSTDPLVNTHNKWFSEYWQKAFNCRFDINTCDVDNQNLNTVIQPDDAYVPFTLLAVSSIIQGVKQAAEKHCSGSHFCSELLNLESGPELYEGIVTAKSPNGINFFKSEPRDVEGEAAAYFERFNVMQVQNATYVKVYSYSSERQGNLGFDAQSNQMLMTSSVCNNDPCTECGEVPVTTAAPVTTTTTEMAQTTASPFTEAMFRSMLGQYFKKDQEFTGIWVDQPRGSEDWQTRFETGQDWIIALGVLAGLGIVCVLVFEIYILYKLMGTKIGNQWRTMWLGQLLLFGLFLCYLTLFAYLFIPSKATCGITRFGVGVSYAICFAILLVKLMVLLTSKTSADTLIPGDVDSPNYLRGVYQFLMFVFVVGVQVVIGIQWLIHVPPEAVQVITNNGDRAWICNHYTWSIEEGYGWQNMTMFVRTEFENHLISLTYIMFLILLTTIIAMKAHGIITNHRESVFIGIAAGFSIPVWVAWGLVGGLNKDHAYAQEFGDACIAFGLFITATLILFAMFLPKVRQLVNMGVEGIYLEDDRDTYYAGSVIMAPPSYKSRPSSVVYVNNNGFNDPVLIGDQNAVHLKHPGSNYSAPVYVKRPESTIGGHSGKVLRMTGDLTGKHPRDAKRSTTSEVNYGYAGSGYGTYRKSRSESGGTLRRAHSTQDLGAL